MHLSILIIFMIALNGVKTSTSQNARSCDGTQSGSYWSCCKSSNLCNVGEGDCDSDEDCAPGLICGTDNCRETGVPGSNWNYSADCCIAACDDDLPDGYDSTCPSCEKWAQFGFCDSYWNLMTFHGQLCASSAEGLIKDTCKKSCNTCAINSSTTSTSTSTTTPESTTTTTATTTTTQPTTTTENVLILELMEKIDNLTKRVEDLEACCTAHNRSIQENTKRHENVDLSFNKLCPLIDQIFDVSNPPGNTKYDCCHEFYSGAPDQIGNAFLCTTESFLTLSGIYPTTPAGTCATTCGTLPPNRVNGMDDAMPGGEN